MKRLRFLFPAFMLCIFLAACGEASDESSVSERDIAESSEAVSSEPAAVDPVQESSEAVVVVPDESSTQESSDTEEISTDLSTTEENTVYILNTKSMKIHNTWCSSVEKIDPENCKETTASIEELEKLGYTKCKQKGDWSK